MRFDYYKRLSSKHKAIYRRSDEVKHVPLPAADSLAPMVTELRDGLEHDREVQVRRASRAIVDGITGMLGVPPVKVIVRRQRPRNDWGELHGYYTMTDDRVAQIEVWMRTAANADVVAFRTYLRTLLHEVCHHLDLVWLKLDESFHTQGFFARESSLTRQLAGRGRRAATNVAVYASDVATAAKTQGPKRSRPRRDEPPVEPRADVERPQTPAPTARRNEQLSLF